MKLMNEDDMDEDYNPNKPENIDKQIDDLANQEDEYDSVLDNLSDDEDDYDESGNKYVERSFNFLGELSTLIDYNVISKYM